MGKIKKNNEVSTHINVFIIYYLIAFFITKFIYLGEKVIISTLKNHVHELIKF